MTQLQRILVVGPSWVGDMVMAQSLYRALLQRNPAVRIHVLAPQWSLPLLKRMPEVARAIPLPLGHGELALGARWRQGAGLRAAGYQQAILLPNSLKSALIPLFARIPLRTGWRGEWRYGLLNDLRRLDKRRYPMTVQRFVALAYPAVWRETLEIPRPLLRVESALVDKALQQLHLQRGERPLLALCPGAEYGPAKRWPAPYFGELAARMRRDGWDVWLFGSAKDRDICAQVAAASSGACVDLAGATSLAQAVDLLSLADAVVSNDSGLMHVAAALERNLVALYGSSDPGFTPPLNERSTVISLRLDCSPCFARSCPLGHLECLRRISVNQVEEAIRGLLA